MNNTKFNFKSNKIVKLVTNEFDDFMNLLKYKFEKPKFLSEENMYYYDENGVKQYTKKGNDAFQKATKLDYLNIKGKMNGVEVLGFDFERLSLEKRLEIWSDLYKQLVVHIKSLEELYPYRDFSPIYQKAKNVAFRIRYEEEDMNVRADQYCYSNFPLIGIHIEPQHISDAHGLTGIKHEFTHFCCGPDLNTINEERTNLTRMPLTLVEGITQSINNDVLEHEKFDKESIDYAKLTYETFVKIAELYKLLLGEKVVINSYFDLDMTPINNAFKQLASRIPRFSKLINDEFLERLNIDLKRLFLSTSTGVEYDNLRCESVYDFPYFMKFLEFSSYMLDREPNYDIAIQNADRIKNILFSLDSFFKEKRKTGKAAIM